MIDRLLFASFTLSLYVIGFATGWMSHYWQQPWIISVSILMLTIFLSFRGRFKRSPILAAFMIFFLLGHHLSAYKVGDINAWMENSLQGAKEMVLASKEESATEDDSLDETEQILEEHEFAGLIFYPENMQDLGPIMAINRSQQYIIAQINPAGQLNTITLKGGHRKDVKGSPFIIEGSHFFYHDDRDAQSIFTRTDITKDGLEVIWNKRIDQPFHHFGDLFEGIGYMSSRDFIDLPNEQISKVFENKPYSRCSIENVMADTVGLFDFETGEIIETISLLPLAADIDDVYAQEIMAHGCRDPLHLNDVRVIKTQAHADFFENGNIGDILVSLRNINTVMLLDKDSHTIKWSVTGLFNNQHSPRLTNRGTMVIFDNLGSLPKNGLTRIVEIDIATREVVGVYEAQGDDLLQSKIKGRLQVWNDRIFVQEHLGGHFFEIACPENQYLSPQCEKRVIFEVKKNKGNKRQFHLAEIIEFTD